MDFHSLLVSLPLPATLTIAAGGTTTIVVGLVFYLSFILVWHKKRISARFPLVPFVWPIIGNIHQLKFSTHCALKDLADKYGPIIFLCLGFVPTVIVSSSNIAKHFLKTHDMIFASRPFTVAMKYIFFNNKDVAFAPYGEHWRKMRKICVLELLTAKRMESFNHVREEKVPLMIRSIWEESESGRKAMNISKAISTLASNMVWIILVKRKFSDDDLGGKLKGFKDLLVPIGRVSSYGGRSQLRRLHSIFRLA